MILAILCVQSSGIKCIHTVRESPPPSTSRTRFSSCATETLNPSHSASSFSPHPTPGNHRSTLCLYEFAYTGYFTEVQSHRIRPFITDYFTSLCFFKKVYHLVFVSNVGKMACNSQTVYTNKLIWGRVGGILVSGFFCYLFMGFLFVCLFWKGNRLFCVFTL